MSSLLDEDPCVVRGRRSVDAVFSAVGKSNQDLLPTGPIAQGSHEILQAGSIGRPVQHVRIQLGHKVAGAERTVFLRKLGRVHEAFSDLFGCGAMLERGMEVVEPAVVRGTAKRRLIEPGRLRVVLIACDRQGLLTALQTVGEIGQHLATAGPTVQEVQPKLVARGIWRAVEHILIELPHEACVIERPVGRDELRRFRKTRGQRRKRDDAGRHEVRVAVESGKVGRTIERQ